jgi:hypothetical protein
MAASRSILSFLSRLWSGWRPRRPLEVPAAAPAADSVDPDGPGELADFVEPALPSSATTPPPAVEIEPPRATSDDDQEPEEGEPEETDEEPEDELTPDAFIADARPAPAEFSSEDLEQRRSEALAAAQIGEHKIPLSGLAGGRSASGFSSAGPASEGA